MTAQLAYTYRAARPDGAQERGVVEAETRQQAIDALVADGLFPIEIEAETKPSVIPKRLPSHELAEGLQILADLIGAGLPLGRALNAFGDLAPAAWKPFVPGILESVRRGRSLGQALAETPVAFPGVILGLVYAGEAGSGLAAAVRRAAQVARSAAETRAALRQALTYPAILVVSGLASVVLLVGVVLPRFATLLADAGQSVPFTTRFVLSAGAAIRFAWLPMVPVVLMAFVLWKIWVASDDGRLQWHGLLLRIPVIGRVRLSAATARVAASAAALIEAGASIPRAITHAAGAADDAALHARLIRARDMIVMGDSIGVSLERERAVTPTAVRLVSAGEQSGRLAEMLNHTAELESRGAERVLRAALRLLEPILIISLGGIVALVAAALLQAVYGVRVT